ncbi:hypothetical protein QAD02_010482 [Eretmocerus hayati]|uniref:Uncharacterized protein n=1 Tax=Eretmocerus hayati TaxID=131215 RepID=A0ACC2NVS3_9HYME|nr:hypothetical protein QAD02_010482 [Eretmocerus hayati]
MKFIIVCAVVLMGASAKLRHGLIGGGTNLIASWASKSGELNLGGGGSLVTNEISPDLPSLPAEPPAPETSSIQIPTPEPQSNSAPSTTHYPFFIISPNAGSLIENLARAIQIISIGSARMEINKLNERLHNTYDCKLVFLSDCPELKDYIQDIPGNVKAVGIPKIMSILGGTYSINVLEITKHIE